MSHEKQFHYLKSNHKRLQISQKEQKWNSKYQMRIVIINSVSCFLVVFDLLALNMKTCWSSDTANTLLHTIWKKKRRLTHTHTPRGVFKSEGDTESATPDCSTSASTCAPYRCVTVFILHLWASVCFVFRWCSGRTEWTCFFLLSFSLWFIVLFCFYLLHKLTSGLLQIYDS